MMNSCGKAKQKLWVIQTQILIENDSADNDAEWHYEDADESIELERVGVGGDQVGHLTDGGRAPGRRGQYQALQTNVTKENN